MSNRCVLILFQYICLYFRGVHLPCRSHTGLIIIVVDCITLHNLVLRLVAVAIVIQLEGTGNVGVISMLLHRQSTPIIARWIIHDGAINNYDLMAAVG